jgi:sugar/nucleoside kinase (ribokinase family)
MPLRIRGGVVCAGNMVYDVLVRPVDAVEWDTTTWVESVEPNLGGNGASTATALGILGVPVRLMAWTGRDAYGDFLLARLGLAGVDTTHVVRCDAPTATTIALVHSDGRRAFLHRPGASAIAFPESSVLTGDGISGAAHLHVANPYGVSNLRRHAARLLTDARAAGLTTSLDTGWDSRGEWMKVLAPCLEHIDLLFANQQEALRLTGAADYTQAGRQLREAGAGTVVVKLGGAGCAVFTRAGGFLEPAYTVEAIDTTGAGDCFAAGFLAALHHACGWRDAACFANAVGALNVQSLGATSGVRGYEETRAWSQRVPRR